MIRWPCLMATLIAAMAMVVPGYAQNSPAPEQNQDVGDFVRNLQPGGPVQVSPSIWVGNVSNLETTDQAGAAATLSNDGVSILVESESTSARTAAVNGAAYLEQIFT